MDYVSTCMANGKLCPKFLVQKILHMPWIFMDFFYLLITPLYHVFFCKQSHLVSHYVNADFA